MNFLSKQELQIFSRQLILKEFSEKKFKSLQNKNVIIVGMGGIGCPVAQYLIVSGIKKLTLIDNDIIKLSNLNRQILFDTNDLGKKKVEIAKKKLRNINPKNIINIIPKRLTHKNISELLSNASLVIDTTDNWETMISINKYCTNNCIPLLSCSIIGFDGQLILFKNSKKQHLCLNCIYPSQNEPDVPRCDTVGVLGTSAGLTGLIAAQLTINFFLNNHIKTEKLIMIDSKTLIIETINVKKNKKCPYMNL